MLLNKWAAGALTPGVTCQGCWSEERNQLSGAQRMLLPAVDQLRTLFPSFRLYPSWAFMENAGGSQVPVHVPMAVSDYMSRSYVQLGAGYAMANMADEVMRATHEFEELLMNAAAGPGDDPLGDGRVILGPSTSVLMEHLASSFAASGELGPDDEVVVSQAAHEANKGPWVKAATRVGAAVRVWPIGAQSRETCPLEALPGLLNERTRVVALPHVSNLLGEVVPVREVVDVVRQLAPRAAVCVDGVALAPHAAVDCQALGCDFYCYSTYKVFGPHLACLFGRKASLACLKGPNHFFIADDAVPYKWELGCLPHELCAGRLAFKQYLNALLGREERSEVDRWVVEQAFARIAELEAPLTERVRESRGTMSSLSRSSSFSVHAFLATQPEVTVYTPGPSAARVPTISFTHARMSSRDIASRLHDKHIAVRHGHMYAYDLVRALGVRDVEDGVVRVSLLHYNSPEEVDRLLEALQAIFSSRQP